MDDTKEPENPAAFPTQTEQWGGMTLRDYFAAQAMSTVLVGQDMRRDWDFHRVARLSYQQADAMLAAREANS